MFRYGGDEFLIILADTSCADARHVVERIRTGLAEWNRAGHLEKFELSLSIGVAEWTEGKTLDDLLDGADHQMYAAKSDRKLSKGQSRRSLEESQRSHKYSLCHSERKRFARETFQAVEGPYKLISR